MFVSVKDGHQMSEYIICPEKIAIYDADMKELRVTVEAEDVCATVTMNKLVTTLECWSDVSEKVREAIKMLNLDMEAK